MRIYGLNRRTGPARPPVQRVVRQPEPSRKPLAVPFLLSRSSCHSRQARCGLRPPRRELRRQASPSCSNSTVSNVVCPARRLRNSVPTTLLSRLTLSRIPSSRLSQLDPSLLISPSGPRQDRVRIHSSRMHFALGIKARNVPLNGSNSRPITRYGPRKASAQVKSVPTCEKGL